VCVGIGWLSSSHVESWRQGRVGSLREFLPVDDVRLAHFLDCLNRWAQAGGLEADEADYVSATRDRRPLRVTAGADAGTERAWRTRWIPADLPAAARERIVQRQEKPPDLVVVMSASPATKSAPPSTASSPPGPRLSHSGRRRSSWW
jgi:hypothetical protein